MRPPIPQTDPPLPPRQTMPTMYDLPSEGVGDPGLPDEYHWFQAELLRQTFQPPNYPVERIFVATDLNLYYDPHNPLWYKRPDWFAVVGGERLYEGQDSRLSYVIWQEGIPPFIVIELLSPGTEAEDLGRTVRGEGQPPTKWQVYERHLRVPYYMVFNRYTDELLAYQLVGGHYQVLPAGERGLWLPEVELGLGLWLGEIEGIERLWLRWYDQTGTWIPTPAELAWQERQRAEQERQRAEQERQRAEQERQRAEQERQRAEQERQRAEQERQRAEQEHQRAEQERQRADSAEARLEQERQRHQRLAERLRALGLDPEADP
ncbi:MAG: Uma2 family endonuclease [Thermostichales cyanobacterium BF3_bins_165]